MSTILLCCAAYASIYKPAKHLLVFFSTVLQLPPMEMNVDHVLMNVMVRLHVMNHSLQRTEAQLST